MPVASFSLPVVFVLSALVPVAMLSLPELLN